MPLEDLSHLAVAAGTSAISIAFILYVIHTTLLAAGRRASPRPRARRGHRQRRRHAPADDPVAGRIGRLFLWASFVSVGAGCPSVPTWSVVARGAICTSSASPSPSASCSATSSCHAATRIRAIAFLPVGMATFLLAYGFTLPSAVSPAGAGAQQRAAADHPRGHGHDQLRHLRGQLRRRCGYLVQGPENRVVWLPSAKVLDEAAYRAVIIGFPIFATLIILGSYWASIAWGRYWGWDPKETSALVTWLIYAVYLHMRGRRAGRAGPRR